MDTQKEEQGMIMVEAIYLVVITIVIVFFGINACVVFHNRMMMTAIANETATSVANTYGKSYMEPFYGYMSDKAFSAWNPYRYVGKQQTIQSDLQKKAKWYACYLISQQEFRADKNSNFDGVTVKCGLDSKAGATTITVTIEREYSAFSMIPVTFFNLSPTYTVKTTGTAVCYDVIHQMNSIAFENEMQSKIEKFLGLTSTIRKIVRDVITIFEE